ncbi:hypothetical protein [Streptomyces sp. NPDC002845]
MSKATTWLTAKLSALLPPRPRRHDTHDTHTAPDTRDTDRAPRMPDPYVWSMPNLYEARWRRWYRRTQRFPSAGHPTAMPLPEEECWQLAMRLPPSPWWREDPDARDEVVRLYVLQTPGQEQHLTRQVLWADHRSTAPAPPSARFAPMSPTASRARCGISGS